MEVCETLTADSLDEALGVVSAVVISHDDMSTTFVVSVARAITETRIVSIWSSNARVTTAWEERNEIKDVIFLM